MLGVLRTLQLADTEITNQTVREILTLDLLENLDLSGTQCDFDELKGLGRLPHLNVVGLNQLTISDAVLQSLAQLQNLGTVSLLGSGGFTQRGVESIAGAPTVKTLLLTESDIVSRNFVDDLHTRYPLKSISAFSPKHFGELQE